MWDFSHTPFSKSLFSMSYLRSTSFWVFCSNLTLVLSFSQPKCVAHLLWAWGQSWAPATGRGGCPWVTVIKPAFHFPPFSLSLFQGHGLHLDKLSALPSLSNCCFKVTGGSPFSPGVVTAVSLSGLVKPWMAVGWTWEPGRQNRLLISQVRLGGTPTGL